MSSTEWYQRFMGDTENFLPYSFEQTPGFSLSYLLNHKDLERLKMLFRNYRSKRATLVESKLLSLQNAICLFFLILTLLLSIIERDTSSQKR